MTRELSDSPQRAGAGEQLDQPWEGDNQDWWDWYVALAENPSRPAEVKTLPPLAASPAPSPEEAACELSTPYAVTPEQIAFFRKEGFIRLQDVFSPDLLLELRCELVTLLAQHIGTELDGGVRERFLSLDMVWLDNALVRAFVLSPRVGKLAADLLGVGSVRLYHDNVLSKEPGCGRTPWHYDDHHFPIATDDVVTVWIPVQPIPREMGPLAFARSVESYRLIESLVFDTTSTRYDREITERFADAGVVVDDGPFDLGEISFHHNLSVHTAGPNDTARSRVVLSNTYFPDGARVVDRPTLVSGDWQKFAPGVAPGEPLASPMNPVCWPAAAP